MTNKEILKADLLDILFEHRNKSYGAYALRREYNYRLVKALGSALAATILFILFSGYRKNGNRSARAFVPNDSVMLKIIEIPPDKPKDPEPPAEPRKIKEVRSSDIIKIVPDDEKPDMPTQDEISTAVVGNNNIDGELLKDPNEIIKPSPSVIPESNGGVSNTAEKEFKPVERSASFPGGVTAWLRFLQRFLQAPDELQAGERKEVKVRFWIDEDGAISKFEIVQSGGIEFDREVLRVMKKMPNWMPAEQNGRKVAVAFTQPVIFVGTEE